MQLSRFSSPSSYYCYSLNLICSRDINPITELVTFCSFSTLTIRNYIIFSSFPGPDEQETRYGKYADTQEVPTHPSGAGLTSTSGQLCSSTETLPYFPKSTRTFRTVRSHGTILRYRTFFISPLFISRSSFRRDSFLLWQVF